MTRPEFLKVTGLAAIGVMLLRPALALHPQPLPSDSAYERMKRLRVDYIRAARNSQLRYAINRELVALAFEMQAAGASRATIKTIGQKSLYYARLETA